MTAQEARAKALSIEEGRNSKQYNEVKGNIAVNAAMGRFEITIYDELLPAVEKKLKEEGYTVKIHSAFDQRDEDSAKITW